MNTLLKSLNISVADANKFELEVNYSRGTSFSEGEYGRRQHLNPKADQWLSADYRHGFIASNTSAMTVAEITKYAA